MRTLSKLSTLTSALILSASGIATATETSVLERNRAAHLQSDSTHRIAPRPVTTGGGQTGGGQAVDVGYVEQGDHDCTGCFSGQWESANFGMGFGPADTGPSSANSGTADTGSADTGSAGTDDS